MPSAATPRFVVVDDNDPSLKYSGPGWTLDTMGSLDDIGDSGPPYMHTVHGTSAPGAVSLQFNGSYIHAIASFDSAGNWTTADWKCLIDGVQIGNEDPPDAPTNDWRFCDSANASLREGIHNFTLEVISTPNGTRFWLDWIAFVPATDSSLERDSILLPAEDSAILYDAPWGPWGPDNFMGTTTDGSSATVSFVGVSATWYGFLSGTSTATTGRGSYTVDGGTPTTFTWTANKNYTTYNHVFFSTPEYNPGSHQLKVTYLGSSPNVNPLTLSHIIVQNGTFPSSMPSSSVNSTSAHHKRMAIFGGVLGGALGIFLISLAVGCLLWRRRQQRKKADSTLEPFISSPASATESSRPVSVVSSESRNQRKSLGEMAPLIHDVHIHRDSGHRFHDTEEIPPNYTPT